MTKFIGRKVDLGVGRETTRGTGATPTFWIPKVDFSFDDKVNKAEVDGSLGNIADSYQTHVLTKWGEGDVSGEVRSQSIGLLLYALFGTLSTTGPADEAYTHAFSLQNDNVHDSLTFTVVDPNNTDRHELVMINSFELNQTLDGVLKFTANFMGKSSKGASETTSYSEEYKFTKKHFSLKLADAIAGLGAASPISIKEFTLTFNANVTLDDVLGTAEPEDFLNQQYSVDGNFSLNYEDETYKNYMMNNTNKAMEVKWTNTDQTISTGDTNPSLEFEMPNVYFFDWGPNYGLNEIVTQNVSFKAYQDLSGDNDIVSTCELINGETGTNY